VDIHSLAGLSTLFGDVASGKLLQSVELVGAQTIKGESLKVYDLKLSDVLVSSFENDPSSNGVETSLSFDYNKISLTHQPLTAQGTLGTPETFGFDLAKNKAAAAVSPSDIAFNAQINQMAASLASFMASSQLGSSGSQDLVSTPPTQQDQHLPTLAATHS
jgi:hypothetical protein